MKHLLSLILLFGFSIGFAAHAFAFDLEVQCSNIKCAVSSKAPLFTSDIQWKPNETVEKSISIRNIDDQQKNIYFKSLSNDSESALDDFMKITFLSDSSLIIWSGTLHELLTEEEIDIATVPPDDEFTLLMQVVMDSVTPNELQGSTSTFDFGFGFRENENQNTSQNSNSSNTSSSHSNSSESNIGGINSADTPEQPTILGVFSNFFGSDRNENDQTGPGVLGASDAARLTQNTLSNSESNSCAPYPYWWGILFIETLLLVLTFTIKKIAYPMITRGSIIALATTLLYFLVCIKWYALTGLLPIILIPIFFYLNKRLPKSE